VAEPLVSNYPSALDNNTSLGGDQVNIKSFVLGSSIGSSETSIPASAAISGVNVPFYLLAESELIYVEGISGSDFTPVVRGAGGTTAVAHTGGIALYVVYAANLFNQFKRAIIAIETELGTNPTVSQAVHTQTGAVATGTTTIPYDDTIPQNTEGDQYMSQAITPTNASNKLLIEVTVVVSHSAIGQMWVCLFQDSVASALAVAVERMDTALQPYTIAFKHEMTAGTTSEITFKVRVGSSTAGTTTFNGSTGARYMGGVFASSLRITEVKV